MIQNGHFLLSTIRELSMQDSCVFSYFVVLFFRASRNSFSYEVRLRTKSGKNGQKVRNKVYFSGIFQGFPRIPKAQFPDS